MKVNLDCLSLVGGTEREGLREAEIFAHIMLVENREKIRNSRGGGEEGNPSAAHTIW